jgi:hypothetical protein
VRAGGVAVVVARERVEALDRLDGDRRIPGSDAEPGFPDGQWRLAVARRQGQRTAAAPWRRRGWQQTGWQHRRRCDGKGLRFGKIYLYRKKMCLYIHASLHM